MQFNEKFSNTPLDEGVKKEAVKKGLRIAGKKAKEVGKKAKDWFNKPVGKDAVITAGLVGANIGAGSMARRYNKHIEKNYTPKQKNESLVEALDRTIKNVKNEAAVGGAIKNIGSKAMGAANKAFGSAKEVGKNTVAGVKKVSSSIKAHPVRTAAAVGTGLAGYGAYKGVKKAAGAGKKAYNNWNA